MINDYRKSIFPVFLGLALVLQIGTIRKDENIILKTQADPISLKQKTEETKDGVKGAPAPSFTFYEKETFLQAAPTQTQKEEENKPKPQESQLPEASFQEKESGEAPDEMKEQGEEMPENEDWWVEDSGSDSSDPGSGTESEEDKDLL